MSTGSFIAATLLLVIGIAKVVVSAPASVSPAGAVVEFHMAKDWLSSSGGELDSGKDGGVATGRFGNGGGFTT